MTTEIDWDEINSIIMDRSSKQSYMVIPNEMNPIDFEKIGFLISEINGFPDSQKTVAESGETFREYLSDRGSSTGPPYEKEKCKIAISNIYTFQ